MIVDCLKHLGIVHLKDLLKISVNIPDIWLTQVFTTRDEIPSGLAALRAWVLLKIFLLSCSGKECNIAFGIISRTEANMPSSVLSERRNHLANLVL